MRTFIIRARKGTTHWDQIQSQVGSKDHFEVVAHSVINAFFISNDFRTDVTFYIILDSASDFPRTIKLDGSKNLSIPGFHEAAIIRLIENALKDSQGLQKDAIQQVAPGIEVIGFGFEKLVAHLSNTHTLYILDHKGAFIRETVIAENPVFILSDHLAMPKKNVQSLKNKGVKTISLGKKMLFASQCVVIINNELDLH